ncbi:MAG: hypothetical protein A2162_03650 [Deltaproteobacteria bacterium RBG_13_52_11b]|nr:MAG: hypothetical protein A2162_03650 [Deltaproteobacteria bacterium RBG_13_52_11b]
MPLLETGWWFREQIHLPQGIQGRSRIPRARPPGRIDEMVFSVKTCFSPGGEEYASASSQKDPSKTMKQRSHPTCRFLSSRTTGDKTRDKD